MAIKKTYLKSRPACKVRFKLSADDVSGAEQVFLAGDFNSWDSVQHPMIRHKDGSFSLELEFAPEQEVVFRYLLDNGQWINDREASEFRYCQFASADNSVLKL